MLNSPFVSRACRAFWVCAACLLMSSAIAQAPSSPPSTSGSQTPGSQEDAGQASSSSKQQKTADTAQDVSGAPSLDISQNLDQSQVRELGGGGSWFSDNVDWLHWGPVGIRSAEALYTYFWRDSTTSAAPIGFFVKPPVGPQLVSAGTPAKLSLATFQTDIAFSQRLRHSRVIWQYSPRVLVLDGHVSRQLSNQDSTLDMLFAPTPRLRLRVTDWFSYSGADNLLADRNLDLNRFSGAIMNPFLNNGQQTLMNAVALPLAYHTSARTSIMVSPFFNYAVVSDSGNAGGAAPLSPPLDITMTQYGAMSKISHAVSSKQSIGAFYRYQRTQQSGGFGKSFFHSFGAALSRQLGRTLLASGDIGVSYSTQGQLNTWTGVGSVTLAKSFQHSSLEATYGRGVTFSGFLDSGYSNYGWVNYSHQFGRRASTGAGFGYLKGPTLGQQADGKYVNGSVSYELFRNVSWFVGYTSFWQSGKGVQLTTGNQMQIQSGLRWAPLHKTGILDATQY
jgi:hypothetical protein